MTYFSHLLHDMQNLDETLASNEEARWTRLLNQLEDITEDDDSPDPYDDGDDE